MGETEVRRRLAAILAADAAGYSRLMAADELATVAALDAARAVFRSQIDARQGRVIDTAGDSVLAVFETAAGAVNAALAIQAELESSSSAAPEARRMRFRVGVHLGDVIEKPDGTIYGDGVNIAARLQTLAEPGGIRVSGIVQEAVRDHVTAEFADEGEHEVKNIARPVRVFRVGAARVDRLAAFAAARGRAAGPGSVRWRALGVAALLVAGSAGAWILIADSARGARASLASLFGRPAPAADAARATIAVLPFENQSGDPKREYFSDGVTEDIIGALGRFPELGVMSKNAVQGFKGKSPTPQSIRNEFGARYIVQGSVREAGGKLRIAVELSDAEKGAQLWSERYDGAGAEVFQIQDRIVTNIAGTLAVKVARIEQQRAATRPTESLEAYDLVLRARALIDLSERAANREARGLLARAQALAPDYAEVHSVLCDAEFHRALYGWVEDATAAMARAEESCRRAIASPDQRAHARAYGALASIYSHLGKNAEALGYTERAIELNASDSTALFRRGSILLWSGRIEEAITTMETAKRFEPHPNAGAGLNLAIAYHLVGRFRESVALADMLLASTPHHVALHAIRAAALAELGNAEAARRAADQVLRFSPLFEAENYGSRFTDAGYQARLRDSLRKAGL